MLIKSLENNHIKKLIKLKEKKYRDIENKYLIEGYHLVCEALKTNNLLQIIILEDEIFDITFDNIIYVDKKIMKRLSDMDSIPKIMAVCQKQEPSKIGSNIILLENIQDPGNMGTIIRSAKAFNVDTVILSNKCVDLYNPKVLRSAQGMIFHLNTVISKDIIATLNELKDKDYLIMGTKVDGGVDIKDVSFNKNKVIIIGNEGSGMSDEVSNLCDEYLYIKMNKDCESLNASVAASILMYEVFRK